MDWIKQLIGGLGETRRVSMTATVDHVELSSAHLIVGLEIDCRNDTNDPIPIKDIRARVYMSGRGKEPQMFYPLERFERVLNKQRMLKVPVEPFTLPPHEIHAVPLRFISEKVFDIPPGGYAVDIELTDTNDTRYTSRVKIRVDSKIKYRHDEAWQGS